MGVIKFKKYGYWYYYWDTYDVKRASINRRCQWFQNNMYIFLDDQKN